MSKSVNKYILKQVDINEQRKDMRAYIGLDEDFDFVPVLDIDEINKKIILNSKLEFMIQFMGQMDIKNKNIIVAYFQYRRINTKHLKKIVDNMYAYKQFKNISKFVDYCVKSLIHHKNSFWKDNISVIDKYRKD